MLTPGAEMFGLRPPSIGEGPRLLKPAIWSLLLVAPAPNEIGSVAGGPTVSAPGPALPLAKLGKIPASIQCCTPVSKSSALPSAPPQELLITLGRNSGRGLLPLTSVGAIIH